jgi:hypothetical protein
MTTINAALKAGTQMLPLIADGDPSGTLADLPQFISGQLFTVETRLAQTLCIEIVASGPYPGTRCRRFLCS